jgi:hypothetical protein
MSLRIYFHIDELARDAVVASALKRELNSRGHKLTYGNRRATSWLLEKFMFSFDVIIIPKTEFMCCFKSLSLDTETPSIVVLFTESVGSVVDLNDDKLTMLSVLGRAHMEGDSLYMEKVSAFLLWGETALNRINKYYPEIADKFTVVGHPRRDEICVKEAVVNAESEKIRVGFITRQDILNDFIGRSPIDAIADSSLGVFHYSYYNKKTGDYLCNPENNTIDEIYIEASDIDVMLKTISRLDPDKYEVYLKVHPREDRSTWINLVEKKRINVKLVDWRMPFARWAKSMDYVIGPASTSFFDCCMLGVKPISIQNINPIYYEHLRGTCAEEFSALTKHIDKPESIESLLELIKSKNDSFVLSREICEILLLEADYPGCKSSISKITDKCIALAEAKKENQLTKYFNYLLFYVSFRFLTWIARVFDWWKKVPEQSAPFYMTRKNMKFIDNLTED